MALHKNSITNTKIIQTTPETILFMTLLGFLEFTMYKLMNLLLVINRNMHINLVLATVVVIVVVLAVVEAAAAASVHWYLLLIIYSFNLVAQVSDMSMVNYKLIITITYYIQNELFSSVNKCNYIEFLEKSAFPMAN